MERKSIRIAGLFEKDGTGAKGPWTRRSIQDDQGEFYQTFAWGKVANCLWTDLQVGGPPVTIVWEQETSKDGQYQNNMIRSLTLDGVMPVTFPAAEPTPQPSAPQPEHTPSGADVTALGKSAINTIEMLNAYYVGVSIENKEIPHEIKNKAALGFEFVGMFPERPGFWWLLFRNKAITV